MYVKVDAMAFKHQLFRISDLDLLTEWDLAKVLKVGDSIPAYRYSASEFFSSLFFFPTWLWGTRQ